jgi:predicted GNAT superfamily acetyltransferase
MTLRAATVQDFPALLALNEAFVRYLSPLSPPRLAQLHEESALHLVLERSGEVLAFLIALREGADYDSVNYRWFAQHCRSFLYIDRIVVGPAARGMGAGSKLYHRGFDHAAAAGVPWLTCEFDLEPPNPASEQFHRKFGFREVGRQRVAQGRKLVSLQAAAVGNGGTDRVAWPVGATPA